MARRRLQLLSYMTPGFPVSLFEEIARIVDADLHLDQARSGPALGSDPFADGTADLGWICSTSFIDLATRRASPSVRLVGVAWVPEDPASGGQPRYFGDVVVREDSPVRTFGDLIGRTVGCNDEVSLSGHMAFRIAAHQFGADPSTFAALSFTGGHHVSLDRVVAGDLDAAVIDSVIRTSRCKTDPSVAALRVVERLGPWPVQPLVASSRLSDAQVVEVRDLVLASASTEAMQRELRAASLSTFVPVDADHYLPIRAALDAVG